MCMSGCGWVYSHELIHNMYVYMYVCTAILYRMYVYTYICVRMCSFLLVLTYLYNYLEGLLLWTRITMLTGLGFLVLVEFEDH